MRFLESSQAIRTEQALEEEIRFHYRTMQNYRRKAREGKLGNYHAMIDADFARDCRLVLLVLLEIRRRGKGRPA